MTEPLEPHAEEVDRRTILFPYRGQEQHGVPATQSPLPHDAVLSTTYVEYEEEKPPPDVVLVKVVTETSSEVPSWNATRTRTQVSVPIPLIGARNPRRRLIIKNVDSFQNLLVWPKYGSKAQAFPLAPLQSLELFTETEVWGICELESYELTVAIIEEFPVTGKKAD